MLVKTNIIYGIDNLIIVLVKNLKKVDDPKLLNENWYIWLFLNSFYLNIIFLDLISKSNYLKSNILAIDRKY